MSMAFRKLSKKEREETTAKEFCRHVPIDDGMTRQSMADECNINKIMDKYQRTGAISHFNNHGERYGEVSPLQYDEAMRIFAESNSMYEELPSSIRNRFPSPSLFLEFVQDPANADELVELGLANPSDANHNESQKSSRKARSSADVGIAKEDEKNMNSEATSEATQEDT